MAPNETGDPITVAIERRIDPAHDAEATAWMQDGEFLAREFPGFLGQGWVRPAEGSDLWYMLYRFRDIETLEQWEGSDVRRQWLERGQGFAKSVRVERRTGIEGWFDAASATSVDPRKTAPDSRTMPVRQPLLSAPPRWKQAISIWFGFYPTALLVSWLVSLVPPLNALPLPARLLVTTVVMTPAMTYVVLPWVTRAFRPWLQRGVQPASGPDSR